MTEPKPHRRSARARRRLRAAALALGAAGGALLLLGAGAHAAAPPAASAGAAISVSPASGEPGATVHVSGTGFVPTGPFLVTVCPFGGCPATEPGAVDCQPNAADAAGDIACSFPLSLSAPLGDVVINAAQYSPYATSAEGTVCPTQAATPVATLPALPTTLPGLPTTPPSPLPNPAPPQGGQNVEACARQASAVFTVVPSYQAPPTTSAVLPPPVVAVPTEPPLAEQPLSLPTVQPAPTAAATLAPAPRHAPKPVRARPVALALPGRAMVGGLLCFVTALIVLLLSFVGPPAPPAPARVGAGSRLSAFVQRYRRGGRNQP